MTEIATRPITLNRPVTQTAPTGENPTALVVAHPDDEALWFSAMIAGASRVIFCFGDPFDQPKLSSARRRAVAALPLHGLVNLALPESGARLSVDWRQPQLTQTGIWITDAAARDRYTANYSSLLSTLRQILAGIKTIYTHNPWGEYGHPEHIQIYRAVAELQTEFGYQIWFPNYIGAKSWTLARTLSTQRLWRDQRTVQPDRPLARRLMHIYRHHHAWTWNLTHRWPGQENFYSNCPADELTQGHPMTGEWMLDVRGLCWWPPLIHQKYRRL